MVVSLRRNSGVEVSDILSVVTHGCIRCLFLAIRIAVAAPCMRSPFDLETDVDHCYSRAGPDLDIVVKFVYIIVKLLRKMTTT